MEQEKKILHISYLSTWLKYCFLPVFKCSSETNDLLMFNRPSQTLAGLIH